MLRDHVVFVPVELQSYFFKTNFLHTPRLEFTNAEGVITKKGRVACEINTADELLITELMLRDFFCTLFWSVCFRNALS